MKEAIGEKTLQVLDQQSEPDMDREILDMLHDLCTRYDWQLLDEDSLCDSVKNWMLINEDRVILYQSVVACYARILYEACKDEQNELRQERAFIELHRYLSVNAQKFYADMIEEVAQTALALIYQKLNECRNPEAFFSFSLFKLRQVGKELLRRNTRNERAKEAISNQQTLANPLPVDQLIVDEATSTLLNAIHQLEDERQQSVIKGKFFEQRSDEEIADILGVTANYVRVLRNRGLSQLRKNKALQRFIES